jgi:hypothetical protein
MTKLISEEKNILIKKSMIKKIISKMKKANIWMINNLQRENQEIELTK